MKSSFILIACLSLLLYSLSLGGDFVFDDIPLVLLSKPAGTPEALIGLFGRGYWDAAGLSKSASYFRPVARLSLELDRRLWGWEPFGFHLTNLLLYTINCLLFFSLARGLLGSSRWGLLSALLFTAHPAHVESVAWIAGRTDLLCGLFLLASLLLYSRFRQTGEWLPGCASMLAFLLALLSKESALLFLPLAILWPPTESAGRGRRARGLLFIGGAVLVILLWCGMRWRAVGAGTRVYGGFDLLSGCARLLWLLIHVLLFPLRLYMEYDETILGSTVYAWRGVSLVLSLVSFALLLLFLRRRARALFLSAWFGFSLLLSWAALSTGIYATDRILYAPSIFYCLLLALGLRWLRTRGVPGRRICLAVFALLLGWYCALTLPQNYVWRNDVTLWLNALSAKPSSPRSSFLLGCAYAKSGQEEKARRRMEKTLQLEGGEAYRPDIEAEMDRMGRRGKME